MLQVQEKLPWFLMAVPSAECAKGGVGGYSTALQLDASDPTGIAGLSAGQVMASSFRTYYVPLNNQQNFIDAYQVSSLYPRLACTLWTPVILSWERQPMLTLSAYTLGDVVISACVLGCCGRVAVTAVTQTHVL